MAMHWSRPSWVSVKITLRPPQLTVASCAVICGGMISPVAEVVASLLTVGKDALPPYRIITSSLPGSDSCALFDGGFDV